MLRARSSECFASNPGITNGKSRAADKSVRPTHSHLLGLLGFGFFVSFCFGPAFFDDLAGAAQGQGVWRNVFGDCGGGGYVGAFSDTDWGDQDAVAAYEDSVFDDGFVFAYAVVVAGDGAGSDVYFLSDFGVSQVSQVVCFFSSVKFPT